MNWIKQNWKKVGLVIVILGVLVFIRGFDDNLSETALINNTTQIPTLSPETISENDPRIVEFKKSLPHFEDYPAKVYSIQPKPKLVHESNLYGMRYWTLTENWVNEASSYNMAGHYLMDRYATGNPDVLIIDGLTGQVFHEYGSLYLSSIVSSSLVIFDPINPKCFSLDGDYDHCFVGEESPRYAIWNGKQFNTICEPIIKAWKLVSCGEIGDKNSEMFGNK